MPILLGGMYVPSISYQIMSLIDIEWLAALYSENAPPVDVADRIAASMPNKLMKMIHQRLVPIIAEADKYVVFTLSTR